MTDPSPTTPLMDEEAWYALLLQARRFRDAGHEEAFVDLARTAFRFRPHRAEPLHDLARHYLATSRGDLALLYADAGLSLELPQHDSVGLEPDVYRFLMKEAFVIAASYSKNDGDKVRGRAICNWLALDREVPEGTRLLARLNYHHWYVEPATSLLPSIDFHPIDVHAPDGYKPSNTSIVRHGEGFVALIRAVNYDLLESGYFDRHGDSSFRQRILLARLNAHLEVTSVTEVHAPADLPPPLHTDSLGFEDPRPIVWRGALWCLSCIRQLNADGRAEMVLARIDQTDDARSILADWRILPSSAPVRWEKNWMPLIKGDQLNFIYSLDPTRILDHAGHVQNEEAPPVATENCGGGTQAVPFDGGWLVVIHEWQVLQTRRHYFHRFAWLDDRSRLTRLSPRFFFRRLASEFAAGLGWHSTNDSLVISFATDDREPTLATVAADDVRRALHRINQHENDCVQACHSGPGVEALIEAADQITKSRPTPPIAESGLPGSSTTLRGTIVTTRISNTAIHFFISNPNDEISKYHMQGRFYEQEELDIIARSYNGGIFVDIGSNVGNHAIYVSKFLNPRKVFVFEPHIPTINILNMNLRLNSCDNVETRYLGIALAGTEDRLKAHSPDPNNIGHTMFFPGEDATILALPGDTLLLDEPIEFIKLDVEGMELEILFGLQKTIERWRPALFVEVWQHVDAAFRDWCMKVGYCIQERYVRYEGINNYLVMPRGRR